jgi:hypothetical protein
MKISITLKDPDYIVSSDDISALEKSGVLDKFVEYNEYVTIEFDTVTKTARVVPVKENR